MEALIILAIAAAVGSAWLFYDGTHRAAPGSLGGGAVTALVAIGLGVAAIPVGISEHEEAARAQRQFAVKMAPLIEQIEYLGFTSPAGYELDDPSLYRFSGEGHSAGTVKVANHRGAAIRVHFLVTTTRASVGCLDDDGHFQPIGPFTAEMLRSTSGCG